MFQSVILVPWADTIPKCSTIYNCIYLFLKYVETVVHFVYNFKPLNIKPFF